MAIKYYIKLMGPPPCEDDDWRRAMSWVMLKTWHSVPTSPKGKEMTEIFRDNMKNAWNQFKNECGWSPPYIPPPAPPPVAA